MNYFIGVLLDASKNRDNKLEWTEKNGQVFYRIGGFNSKWNFDKANKVPCDSKAWLKAVTKARQEMREVGLSAPGVFRTKRAKDNRK